MIKDGKAKELFRNQDLSSRTASADAATTSGIDAGTSIIASSRRTDAGPKTPFVSIFAQLGPPRTDKERIARERIDTQKYDVEAWEILANEAQSRPIAQSSAMFELILSTFPTAGKYWKMYVEAQMNANNDDSVRYIFSRCLLNCFHIELWKSYIKFIRRVNEQRGLEGREETRKAFDFMVGHVGMDIAAGPLWLEYIAFLKATPVSTTQEETQRMILVRKAYQQAVLAPIHHVEQLWKEYENFENSISRALAKGLLAEYQPKHYSARAVYRERKKHWEQVDQNLLPVPHTGSLKEEQQCAAWKQLLSFEKGNPQRLEPGLLAKRVVFTYEQCLMYFYHYPDIWYDYAMWHAQTGSNENAVSVFRRALKALPDASLLFYAYAEFEEARGSIKEAKTIYESLVSNESIANSLAFIQLMRFVRRTEGIDAARKVFFEARKNPLGTYHLYVATAALVFCVDKDAKRARDTFELGLKKYIHEPSYVLEYADFLCRLNDDRNVRALFERALNVLPPEESVEVWNRFLAFEQMYGDIPSMLKVAQRRKEALAGEDGLAVSETSLQQLISRYRFLDLWPCSSHDLDHLARQQMMLHKAEKQSSLGGITGAKKVPGSGAGSSTPVKNLVRPDVSQMAIYDPKGTGEVPISATSISALGSQATASMPGLAARPPLPHGRTPKDGTASNSNDEFLKNLPSALGAFLARLPAIEGPFPDADVVLSIFLQNDTPNSGADSTSAASSGVTKVANGSTRSAGAASSRPARQPVKRKEREKQDEEEETPSVQTTAPRDVFRMRQLQRSRAGAGNAASGSNANKKQQTQAGSTSGGSAFSGERSTSSG